MVLRLGKWAVRIFKTKAFARLARRESVPDASLVRAVDEAERGLIEADLRGGVIKQRVARAGSGKSGGYRVILAYHSETRSLFLYLFAKNAMDNISDNQLITFREFARTWLAATDKAIAAAVATGIFVEIHREEGDAEATGSDAKKSESREKAGQGARHKGRRPR
jgi:hypothetical protein